MEQRSVAIVNFYAPASRSTGARRMANLAEELRRRGTDVTVIASASSATGTSAAGGDVLTADLMTTRLNWRRDQLGGLIRDGAGTYREESRVAAVIPPDPQIATWSPFAARALSTLLRRKRIDCVITSSPPQSAHIVGFVARRHRVPWIVDLRDGWQFEPLSAQRRPRPSAWANGLLEHRVIRNADAITAVTPAIADDIRQRFDRDAVCITNGFAASEFAPDTWESEHANTPLRVVYTGAITAGARGDRLLEPLIEGMRIANAHLAVSGRSARLEIAGPSTAAEQVTMRASAPMVEYLGALDRDSALELQRQADVLVVLIGDGKPGVATGKIYEYLAARRPVLVVGADSAAADITRSTGSGVAVRLDPEAIGRALRRLADGDGFAPSSDAVAAYSWTNLATRFEAVIADTLRIGASAKR